MTPEEMANRLLELEQQNRELLEHNRVLSERNAELERAAHLAARGTPIPPSEG